MIELKSVVPDNYESTLALAVAKDQEVFVASVTKSLADAFVYKEAQARVAYEGEVPVGFLLLFPSEVEGEPVVNIVRVLVDHKHQGRGVGRNIVTAAIELAQTFSPRPQRIRISTLPENEIALGLYRSLGFKEGGTEDGEVVLWLGV